MSINNKCAICGKNANQTGSHIFPMNLIKNCIGERGKEISYDIEIQNNKIVSKNIYIGNEIKYKNEEINKFSIKEITENPYTLDYILCSCCERKLGMIEGKVYDEIILKIKDDRYKSNFKKEIINDFEVLIPTSKRISKEDLDIYFYSIILRFIVYKKHQKIDCNISEDVVKYISDFVKVNLYKLSDELKTINLGLIIYITNTPKNHLTFLITDKFEKLIIPVCNFYIILENQNLNTPFGQAINLINDTKFKFIKNSRELDENLFSLKKILL